MPSSEVLKRDNDMGCLVDSVDKIQIRNFSLRVTQPFQMVKAFYYYPIYYVKTSRLGTHGSFKVYRQPCRPIWSMIQL